MSDCLFCQILAGQAPSYRIYEDETSVAFLDIAPFHRGHTLIIPRRHVPDGTTDPAIWADVAQGIVSVTDLVKAKLGAAGANILSNSGVVAGQGVFHFHVHIIPRYEDNPGMAGLSRPDPDAGQDLEGLCALLRS